MSAEQTIREFHVNEYLSLRFENGETIIYVDGKEFRTCKAFVFQIDEERVKDYDEVPSIDDLMNRVSSYRVDIDPKTEFWGHCSNLQTWAEHDYDTRLLDMRLAFPLLKRIAEAGDGRARIRYEEEIIARYAEGTDHVRSAMLAMGLLQELEGFDYLYGIMEHEQADHLVGLLTRFHYTVLVQDFIPRLGTEPGEVYVELRNKDIAHISIPISDECPYIPSELAHFPRLVGLALQIDEFTGDYIGLEEKGMRIPSIVGLSIDPRNVESKEVCIDIFSAFPNLVSTGLMGYKRHPTKALFSISDSLQQCRKLERIQFQFCSLKRLPNGMEKFPRLEIFVIQHVEIYQDPIPLEFLKSGQFKAIQLQSPQIKKIADEIVVNNKNLRYFVSQPELITKSMRQWFKDRNFFKTRNGYFEEMGTDPQKVERWAKIPIMWNFGF